MKIKTFLINRDLVTWPKAMLDWIQRIPELEPIILDNGSTYRPTLEWYAQDPCRVISLNFNYGHKVLWSSGLFYKEIKDDPYYIVSDPDFDMSTVPLDIVDVMKEGLQRYNTPKCGPAIRIDDIPNEYPLKNQVLIWETPFWQNPLESPYYAAPLDTTFALHDTTKCRDHIIGGVRIGEAYTTRHLPFYITPETIDEEIAYYFRHANTQVSSQARHLNEWVQQCYQEKQ